MKKPKQEDYSYHTSKSPEDEPTGWLIEGSEEAYNEAMNEYKDYLLSSFNIIGYCKQGVNVRKYGNDWHVECLSLPLPLKVTKCLIEALESANNYIED